MSTTLKRSARNQIHAALIKPQQDPFSRPSCPVFGIRLLTNGNSEVSRGKKRKLVSSIKHNEAKKIFAGKNISNTIDAASSALTRQLLANDSLMTTVPPTPHFSKLKAGKLLWFSILQQGAFSHDKQTRVASAQELVDVGCVWDQDEIFQLCRCICILGAEQYRRPIATFAAEIYNTFRKRGRDDITWRYLDTLHWTILWEFSCTWDSTQELSITHKPRLPVRYVNWSICVAGFIGDFYSEGILDRNQIFKCLELLMDNIMFVEHLEAIHALLSHAGIELFASGNVIEGIVKKLTDRTQNMEHSSVVGRRLFPGEIVMRVQYLNKNLLFWRDCLVTLPTPSPPPKIETRKRRRQ